MANKLIRHSGRGHPHFITFTCYRRLPLRRSLRAKNVFVQTLEEIRDRYGFSLVGYAVMREHVRLLICEAVRGTPSTVVQLSKQRVSRRLCRKQRAPAAQLSLTFARREGALPRLWQREFYDFNVWSLKKRVEKLHCLRLNPLKKKLVAYPKDWPWSSFSFYAKKESGPVRIDPLR